MEMVRRKSRFHIILRLLRDYGSGITVEVCFLFPIWLMEREEEMALPQSQLLGAKASQLLRGEGKHIEAAPVADFAQAGAAIAQENVLEWVKGMASGRKPSARVRFFQEKVFDGERIVSMRAEGAAIALNVSNEDMDGAASVGHVHSEKIVMVILHMMLCIGIWKKSISQECIKCRHERRCICRAFREKRWFLQVLDFVGDLDWDQGWVDMGRQM